MGRLGHRQAVEVPIPLQLPYPCSFCFSDPRNPRHTLFPMQLKSRRPLTPNRALTIFTLKGEYVMPAANLDQTLLALADPTRRAILQRLSRGSARVTEIAEPFDISLNSVSKHIR